MSKAKVSQWWRCFIGILIGLIIFVGLIPSCSIVSFSKEDALVVDSRESFINETLTFEEIVANLPTAEEIKAMSIAPHPRLLASEARFAEIKQQVKTNETMKKWYWKLHTDAKKFIDTPPPLYKPQDNRGMLKVSRTVLKTVTTLALMYRLDRDELYLQRTWQELEAASKFIDWNPSHFLTTAEMTAAFAIGYDWLYEYWNQQQKELISSAIVKKGLKPALNAYIKSDSWTKIKSANNWNQVCNGGVSLGAIAVLENVPKLASTVLHSGLKRLPETMKHYAPDGAWNEGVDYWHYGSKYNTLILSSLDTAFNNDFNLSKIPGFSETGNFPIYMTSTIGRPFNFADANESRLRSPQLFWMANKFNEPVYSYFQKEVAKPEALDLIWYKPLNEKKFLNELSLDKYFRGSEIVSMREQWKNYQGIFIGFKAGDNQAAHGNLDLGTFVLDASGVRWAVDLGSDDYNLPGYFDRKEKRWRYYRTRAEGQNTLVINPDANPDQNPKAIAKIIHFDSQSNKARVVADLTPAYAFDVDRLQREIILDRNLQRVLIEDRILSRNPINVWWFMHTKADISISKDGKTAILSQNNAQITVRILNRSRYNFEIIDAQPMKNSPNPFGQTVNSDIKKLAVQLKNIQKEELRIAFDCMK